MSGRTGRLDLLSELKTEVRGVVAEKEILAPHTSFNVGGPADLWIEPQDIKDVCEAIKLLAEYECPVTLLGNGTNCLIADAGIRGAVICLRRNFRAATIKGTCVLAESGVSMPLLSQQVSKAGLTGYEWACGVPGSIGGAVVMNAGAHGGDTSESLREVQVVDLRGESGWIPASDLQFSYRHSAVPEKKLIVTTGRFEFQEDDPVEIQERLVAYREKRRAAQPETSQCAGSIFKNPSGGSAGRILENLGAKGWRVGGAEVSEKHANFIVNAGGAAASDVWTLILKLQRLAFEQAGVRLETEVLRMGDWEKEITEVG